jgi:hypothetical protein
MRLLVWAGQNAGCSSYDVQRNPEQKHLSLRASALCERSNPHLASRTACARALDFRDLLRQHRSGLSRIPAPCCYLDTWPRSRKSGPRHGPINPAPAPCARGQTLLYCYLRGSRCWPGPRRLSPEPGGTDTLARPSPGTTARGCRPVREAALAPWRQRPFLPPRETLTDTA